MCRVKYLFSGAEPEESELAEALQDAEIRFVCAPTSGPVAIWINGRGRYGLSAVREAVQELVSAAGNSASV